jgi:hypothetical protein
MPYYIQAIEDTWFKLSTGSSSTLPDDQKSIFKGKTTITVDSYKLDADNHIKFTLSKDDQGQQVFINGRNTWLVYAPHVNVLRSDGSLVDLSATASLISKAQAEEIYGNPISNQQLTDLNNCMN